MISSRDVPASRNLQTEKVRRILDVTYGLLVALNLPQPIVPIVIEGTILLGMLREKLI